MNDPRMPLGDVQDVPTWQCIKHLQDQQKIIKLRLEQLDRGLQAIIIELKAQKK